MPQESMKVENNEFTDDEVNALLTKLIRWINLWTTKPMTDQDRLLLVNGFWEFLS